MTLSRFHLTHLVITLFIICSTSNCDAYQKVCVVYKVLSVTHVKLQYIPRNMHTDFDLLCFVVVIHWLIFPYPSGLLHLYCGNLTIAPVPAKQPWWIWINISCEFIMNDCITTTKQITTNPCAYFLGYTVFMQRGCPLLEAFLWQYGSLYASNRCLIPRDRNTQCAPNNGHTIQQRRC